MILTNDRMTAFVCGGLKETSSEASVPWERDLEKHQEKEPMHPSLRSPIIDGQPVRRINAPHLAFLQLVS
jgi:hypothetical protein